MDAGDYITSTLTVPEATGLTVANWAVVFPDGSTDSGVGTADGTTFTAVIGPIPATGWGRTTWTVTGPGAGVQHSRWYAIPAPTGWGVWPPCLEDLKLDLSRDAQVSTNDGQLAMVLDAAISKVRKMKSWQYDIGTEPTESSDRLLEPDYDLILGTIRLAGRWHIRRRSPDGMIQMSAEMGSSRVASFDPDIDRLLRVGRYQPMMFA